VSDSRAAARPRLRDQRLGDLRPPGRRSLALAPVVLWGVAAVLALLAPFLQLFVIAIPTGRVRSIDGVDGWGNFGAALGSTGHGARFGIALWACALGLAWLAVQRGRDLRRADRSLDPVTAGMAIGMPCLVAGVTGSLVLFVQAYVTQLSGLPSAGGGALHARWSWGLWLPLASLMLAVAATCILFWASRSATDDDEPDLDEVGTAGRAPTG
jgi:hypothetical protein